MKTFNSVIALSFIIFLASCAEDVGEISPSSVPEPVKESFAAKYPNTKNIEWEKEGEYFEAEFKENGLEKSVRYDADGNIIATETEVADLPSSIIEYINKNYSNYTIEESEKEESTDGTFFEVELESEDQEIELIFDSNGNFIKQEDEDENEEDEDDEEGEDEDDENEREINTNELPQVIKNAINEQYPNAEMLEADEITQKDGSITYDVEIKYDGKVTELMYDAQGNFLGVEADE